MTAKDFLGSPDPTLVASRPLSGLSGGASVAHTPGPWRVYGSEIISHPSIDDAGHAVSERIAEVWQRGPDSETTANARLIAAAPEMLAALQMVITDPFRISVQTLAVAREVVGRALS